MSISLKGEIIIVSTLSELVVGFVLLSISSSAITFVNFTLDYFSFSGSVAFSCSISSTGA